jgi:hypothetical protein
LIFSKKIKKTGDQTLFYFAASGGEILVTHPLRLAKNGSFFGSDAVGQGVTIFYDRLTKPRRGDIILAQLAFCRQNPEGVTLLCRLRIFLGLRSRYFGIRSAIRSQAKFLPYFS